jgi:NAD(P)-dependent dehydrogenase (short-subunit alcohol dehydrogenase family)
MDTAELYASIRPRYPELSGQVALVTGSARGIGKGIALRLAREGLSVIIHGHVEREVQATTAEFQALGANATGITADLTRASEIDRLLDETLAAYGRLDVLVNNAAELRRLEMFDVDLKTLDYQLNINLRAPYWCAQRAGEIMRRAGSGNIISIGSIGGIRAHWAGLPYDVTKAGIDMMTKAMALNLAREGVRVNAIAPGPIHIERSRPLDDPESMAVVERVPMRRFGLPVEIGAAVAFLISPDAAYITGHTLVVDGGTVVQLSPPGQDI